MTRDREADLATLRAVHGAAERGDFPRAAALAGPALEAGLEHPLLYNVVAIGFERAQQVSKAALLLESGVARFPADVGLRNALGLCLLRLERPAEAQVQFDALLATEPALPFAHASRGTALQAQGQLAGAEQSYRRALELDPRQAVAMAGLAAVAVRRGLYRGARVWADQALALLPGYPDAVMSLAAAELGDGAAERAVKRLEALVADTRLGRLERAYANGLLGDALDALDEPAQAYVAYARCNEELHAVYAAEFGSGTSALAAVREMTAYFEGARPEDWRSSLRMSPDAAAVRGHVFILGFPRSGTTLLEVALEGHPGAVSLGENELLIDGVREFMAGGDGLERLARAEPAVLERLRMAYWARAAEAGAVSRDCVFIDKHPLNTLKLPLIARLFPAARVVFAFRDPRDVVLSCFRRRFQMSAPMYELLSLESAARFYDAVMTLVARMDVVLPSVTRRVRYEGLVADFDGEMRRLCTFLDLEWSGAMREFAARTQARASATPSTAQLARGLDSGGIGGWRRYRAALAPVLPVLEPWVQRFGYMA
jgi:Tfp pilus assembly protein PilF